MNALFHRLTVGLFASSLALSLGCGGSKDESTAQTDDEEEARAKGACTISDAGGGSLTSTTILKNADPVAALVLKGTGTCPKTFQEVVARLRVTDKNGCADDPASPAGMQVRLISERSQVRGVGDSYRAVVTRQCDGRPVHGLFMSVFGIAAGANELPPDVELIGFDAAAGQFNYYALEGGKWKFFGGSRSLVEEGYDCTSGACVPKAASHRRCANCHTGGGLVMKELNSPWVHWEGDTTTPGAQATVDKFKSLWGKKSDGIELESTVKGGNSAWTPKRIELAKASGSVADLLRPLFCTVELNLQGSSTQTSASGMTQVRSDFLFDPAWSKSGVPVDAADYVALLAANGQRIVDGQNQQLKGPMGQPVVDTVFPFTFPERSGADVEYVQKLVAAGVVDDELVKDVLVLDFTRPIFSKARCEMLQFAPELTAEKRTAQAIKEGFVANLKAANPAPATIAGELLANLGADGQAATHGAKLDAFLTACKARPKKEFLADAMTIASQRRNLARTLPVLEFAESLPFDTLSVAESKAFDPATCKLVDKLAPA